MRWTQYTVVAKFWINFWEHIYYTFAFFFYTLLMKSEAEWSINILPVLIPLTSTHYGEKCSFALSSCFLWILSVFTSGNSYVCLKDVHPIYSAVKQAVDKSGLICLSLPHLQLCLSEALLRLSICKLVWFLVFFSFVCLLVFLKKSIRCAACSFAGVWFTIMSCRGSRKIVVCLWACPRLTKAVTFSTHQQHTKMFGRRIQDNAFLWRVFPTGEVGCVYDV